MAITQTITELPDAPQRNDPTNFDTRADAFVAALELMPPEQNQMAVEMNTLAGEVNQLKVDTQGIKDAADQSTTTIHDNTVAVHDATVLLKTDVTNLKTDVTTLKSDTQGIKDTAVSETTTLKDLANTYMQGAQVAAAAAGSAAGLPALASNAGRALMVADDELSVYFGNAGAKNYAVATDQQITVATGLVAQAISVLPAGVPPLYSMDNVTFAQMGTEGISEEITGGLYFKGWSDLGGIGAPIRSSTLHYDMTFLNGDLYTVQTSSGAHRMVGLTEVETSASDQGGAHHAIATDGTDILLFRDTGTSTTMYVFAGGDLSQAPTEVTGFPEDVAAAAVVGGNLLFLTYTVASQATLYKMQGLTASVDSSVTVPGGFGWQIKNVSSMEVVPGSEHIIITSDYVHSAQDDRYSIKIFEDYTLSTELQSIPLRNNSAVSRGGTPIIYGIAYDDSTSKFYGFLNDFNDSGSYDLTPFDQPFGAVVFGV